MEGILLLEGIRAVLERADKLWAKDEVGLGETKRKLAGYLAPRKVSQAGAEAAAAVADLNALRDQAAKEFREAARKFALAEGSIPDVKLRWTYSTLAGLAWEKQYYLLRAEDSPGKQAQDDMAEARKNAEEAVKRALMAGREGSPYLAPAVLLKARLDALK
jgi:hypothetical protein